MGLEGLLCNCVPSSNLPLFHFSMSSDYLHLSFIFLPILYFSFIHLTPTSSSPYSFFLFLPFPILPLLTYPSLPSIFLFLPPSSAPTRKQYTVAVIKPDAVANGVVEEILAQVEAVGLEVLCQEERTLTREEAEDFYKQHEGSVSFADRTTTYIRKSNLDDILVCVCVCMFSH